MYVVAIIYVYTCYISSIIQPVTVLITCIDYKRNNQVLAHVYIYTYKLIEYLCIYIDLLMHASLIIMLCMIILCQHRMCVCVCVCVCVC